MIAVDTNILLRYLLRDDKQQAEKAAHLINGDERVLITDVVLAEMIWTLGGRKYQLKKEDIVNTIESLFKEPNLHFEDDQVVWRALQAYRGAEPVKVGKRKKEADFADALIAYKAQSIATKQQARLQAVYTFDKAASQLPHNRMP
ncbi:MAG: type II toxin-antitoxin system VapC family toxin [Gammaproteobacteria bacterium]|nr:type II toxin-antitoxin system VapC family toxin [Gammaproteobacteria bacterium]